MVGGETPGGRERSWPFYSPPKNVFRWRLETITEGAGAIAKAPKGPLCIREHGGR